MPFTKPYQAQLAKLHRDSEAFEARYSSTPYNKIPVEEIAAQRKRDIAIHSANRSAAIAEGNGPLFESLCGENGNDTDRAEKDRLYWAVYALGQRTEDSQREAA